MISRRDFLAFAGMASVAYGFSSQDDFTPQITSDNTQLKRPYNVPYRHDLAEKVLKLAKDVIQRKDAVERYDDRLSNPVQKIVDVHLTIGETEYNVMVMASNKKRNIMAPDSITIKFGLKTKGGANGREAIIVMDRGLDARCDYGKLPETSVDRKKINHDFDLYFSHDQSFDYKSQAKFQNIYWKEVEKLLKFYAAGK